MDKGLIEDNYKEILNNINIPMLIIDSETGDLKEANLAASRYYGYSREELIRMNIWDINILSQEEILKEMDKAKKGGGRFFKFKHKLYNGQIREVEVHTSLAKAKDKNFLLSVIYDVGEKDYWINKSCFDSLFNNSPEAIAIIDKDFKVLNVNKGFKKTFKYELLEEIIGKDIIKVLSSEIIDDTFDNFKEPIVKGKFVSQEIKRKRKDGKIINALLLGFPLVLNGETVGAYCIYLDSVSKDKEKQIEFFTGKDPLTGLLNRDFFLSRLDYKISQKSMDNDIKEKFALIILSVNELKEINEVLGHLVGDKILKEFVLMLRAIVEPRDIIARFGTDEFAILIPEMRSVNELKNIIHKILNNLNKSIFIDGNEFQITTSAGIAIYPDDGTESITLVRRADIAMSKSKEFNINSPIKFDCSLDREIQEYFQMKNDLTKAISNEELFLNYQPIYDIDINELIGVEALVRWHNKAIGIVPPSKFIPIAEKTGLIHSMGDWILLNACKQNKKWQELGYDPIYMSVNISVLQLEQPNFFQIVKEILKESTLDPKYLQLEITETFFTQNYELIESTIKELSKLGIGLAIDDFGTGYSSLGQLCRLNINNLKIDKTFINGVDKNSNKGKIVKTVISLAESLNIGLIAEGVETKEELNFLKENRCTVVQGYFFSKPVGTDKIEKMLINKKI